MDIDREIESIVAATKAEDFRSALSQCANLIERRPDAPEAWRHKGFVHAQMKNYELAAEAMTRAIELAPNEPAYYMLRGRYLLMVSDNESAAENFTQVLKICDKLRSDYYREVAHFLRAESYVRQSRFEDALRDCKHVRDDFRMWINSLRTKRDIVERCRSRN